MHLVGIKKTKTSLIQIQSRNTLEDKKYDILKKYVCELPFNWTDVQTNGQYVCCPSWANHNIRVNTSGSQSEFPMNMDDDVMRNWTSKAAKQIRNSVYDGSYKYCDKNVCPHLNKLINTQQKPWVALLPKEEFEKKYNIRNKLDVLRFKTPPEEILFGFDRSCNLKCPSCRVSLIANDDENSKPYKVKEHLIESIENGFGYNLKRIVVTGSGDPFYSKIYRKYLQNFDIKKYPLLEEIQIVTNATMLNEKMWNSLNSAPYIKFIEISIDAGTKNTYENVTRLNGQWDILIKNLKFLSTRDTINNIVCSFVVSKNNYKEMKTFYDIISDIFKEWVKLPNKELGINFRQIVDWSTYPIDEFKELQVFEPEHELHSDFLYHLDKISYLENSNHNFYHLLDQDGLKKTINHFKTQPKEKTIKTLI